MYPLGHLGTGLIIATLFSMPVAAFVLGVFLPDIVDKGLAVLGLIECSRSLAHNVFFAAGAGLVALAVTRRKEIGIAVFFGCVLHLIQDSAHFVPYFYPLVSYTFDCGPISFQPGGFEIAMEFVGAGLIVFWWRYRAKLIYLRGRILKPRTHGRLAGKTDGKLRVEKGRHKKKAR